MRKQLIVCLAVAALLLAAGCVKKIPVTVSNNLENWEITEITFNTAEAEGENLLSEPIPAEGSTEVEVAPGSYDVVTKDSEGGSYSLDFVVPEEGTAEIEIGPADRDGYDQTTQVGEGLYAIGEGDAPVWITNDLGGWDIYYAYIDPSDSPWGDDRLESEILSQDETLIVLIDPGTYDIQLEDEDGDTYTQWEVEIDEGGYEWNVTLDDLDTETWGGGTGTEEVGEGHYETGDGSAPVSIVNGLGDWTIWYAYVDPSGSPWGDDRLGAHLLEPEEELTVWVDEGTYDLRVEDEDGDTYTQWEVEIDEDGYEWAVTLEDMD
ncbi:hypothetical protein GF402_11455 [Candidatus Fermentibacteria bacterium]|nr:hypothetical protein [Candidatus Fermentibacteria bacterium]